LRYRNIGPANCGALRFVNFSCTFPLMFLFEINRDQRCACRRVFILHGENIIRYPGSPYEDVREIPDKTVRRTKSAKNRAVGAPVKGR